MRRSFLKHFIIYFNCIPLCISIALEDEEIVSPEVHPDRTVTFRFRAPDADEVGIYTQFTNDYHLMEKDENGIWSIRLGPAEPKIYLYEFAQLIFLD
jgi:enterochelin esterase family protein